MDDGEKKKKKKSSKSDEKKKKKSSKHLSTRKSSPQLDDQGNPSLDFEAGVIFNRYDSNHSGVLRAEEFRQMWKEALHSSNGRKSDMRSVLQTRDMNQPQDYQNADELAFEAGQIFSKYDNSKTGKIDKIAFERMVREHPELLRLDPKSTQSQYVPTEVITGTLLTHYDETAGVAIPRSALDNHRSMGNTVNPLTESYRARYDRLRALVTGRLLPRREHLLQLRRQLQNTSTEVEASRKCIERETIADTEQILESGHINTITTGVLLTSAAPGSIPLEAVRLPRAAMMVELIQQFADITAQIERLSTKTLNVQVDFPIDDFPKETAERLEVISRCDRYAHALSVKDHMLWVAIQEKDQSLELLDEERRLSHEYAQEVAKWADLSQTLSYKVNSITQEKERLETINRDLLNLLRDHNIFYVPK
eukprot:gene6967-14145_t